MTTKAFPPWLAVFLFFSPLSSILRAQDARLPVDHSDCTFLGSKREVYVRAILQGSRSSQESDLALTTRQVSGFLGSRGHLNGLRGFQNVKNDTIDSYINADLQAHGIIPADKTTDWEFVRRLTLDLTGRIPTPQRALAFVQDQAPAKRAKLIEELLASPEWVDKWTMYYSDLYQNTANSVQVRRYPEGRNAFYKWIHDSLAANKPYNAMATELIAAQGGNSFDQSNGQMNWLVGGVVTGGPAQDIFDQQAANIATTFLGLSNLNCVLCHNGRGHLDTLNLWASKTTRYQAWQLSSFLSKTRTRAIKITDPANPRLNYNYWTLETYSTDYALNTSVGNRPARTPAGSIKTVAPTYFFTGEKPDAGEDYRAALARFVTKDPQFARATVNYLWAQFFGRGIVDPPDQFDPARLDPNSAPPDPWTLQPSNPALLESLTRHFIDAGFDLKAAMREIANSDTYQLSSRYNGQWSPDYEKYFARKFVRRLWSEEIHDAVVQATGVLPNYTVANFSKDSTVYGVTSPGFGNVTYAMQLPDTIAVPDGGGQASRFMDSFLRGDRDVNPRRPDGSILQALNLMNDLFIESRIKSTNTAGLLAKSIGFNTDQLIDTLYLSALSRYPTDAERTTATATLNSGARRTSAEDLFWSLFNKVDFVFNY